MPRRCTAGTVRSQGEVDRMWGQERILCRAQVGVDTGPPVVVRAFQHGRPHRIQLDVADHAQRIGVLIHQT